MHISHILTKEINNGEISDHTMRKHNKEPYHTFNSNFRYSTVIVDSNTEVGSPVLATTVP